ncbi:hypothetical protein [Williamsia sp. CHRR-6]|uniref:hypothetical protein n=1 Tax=Williamsia sp. CHRR-6 TaxID=2835871 RepID=UPI001BDB4514|nr:hypothetical protein [Williamsia sp. CHRR-6]MBT0567233.1 hypothetical protein [Williamsia sp. CHRR-6]
MPKSPVERAEVTRRTILFADVLRDIGDRLEGVTGSFARAAHVCALGDTVAEALARAQEGVGAMHFTVKASGWTGQTTQTIS